MKISDKNNYKLLKQLHEFKSETLCEMQKRDQQEWIINKRCVCTIGLNEDYPIYCKHIQQCFREKYKEKNKDLCELSILICEANSSQPELLNNLFERLKASHPL